MSISEAIRKRRNIAHVYSSADYPAALADRAQSCRHQFSDRSIDDRGVQRDWGNFVRAAGPYDPELSCETLRGDVIGSGESIDRSAFASVRSGLRYVRQRQTRKCREVQRHPP